MNQATKPVVYAISLYLLTAVSHLLTGCASHEVTPSQEPLKPTPTETEQSDNVKSPEVSKPEPYEYKAIPFEQVLKQDQETASRQAANKPVEKAADAGPPRKPSTPLRPPQETPVAEPKQSAPQPKPVKKVSEPAPEPEPEIVAAPEQSVPEPVLTQPPALEFTLDQLPITIKGNWVLASDLNACTLQTVPVVIDDGAGKTPVSLRLDQEKWLIDTKSDIDMGYLNTGIFLSNGVHIPLESIVKDTKISILKQKQQLTDALKASDSVRVALGFWPTWPMTETRSLTISVAHFPQALAAWETCNQKVSAR